MMGPVILDKPNIRILASRGHGHEETLRQLQYGIEEESVPFEVSEGDSTSASELAWEAAERSRLDVGLGLDGQSLILCYGRLGKEHPLFAISARAPEWQIRALGANAARLVKKLPFKSLDEKREVSQ